MRTTKKNQEPQITQELVELPPAARKRLPRPHPGFEQYVQALVDMYNANADELGKGSVDTDAILAALKAYQELAATQVAATKHLQMVLGTRLLHGSTVWSGLLDIYMRGQRVARTNLGVQRTIADFAQFMKQGPRKKKTVPVTP